MMMMLSVSSRRCSLLYHCITVLHNTACAIFTLQCVSANNTNKQKHQHCLGVLKNSSTSNHKKPQHCVSSTMWWFPYPWAQGLRRCFEIMYIGPLNWVILCIKQIILITHMPAKINGDRSVDFSDVIFQHCLFRSSAAGSDVADRSWFVAAGRSNRSAAGSNCATVAPVAAAGSWISCRAEVRPTGRPCWAALRAECVWNELVVTISCRSVASIRRYPSQRLVRLIYTVWNIVIDFLFKTSRYMKIHEIKAVLRQW